MGVRLQSRCLKTHDMPVCATHVLVSSQFMGNSKCQDFGPREMTPEERDRRNAMYPPIDPEKKRAMQEEGWTASLTHMLIHNRPKEKISDSKSELIRRAISENPDLTNPEIAKKIGVLNSLVHHVRRNDKERKKRRKTLAEMAEEVGCPLQFAVEVKTKLEERRKFKKGTA